MSVLNRPYAGTWAPNLRKIIQYTPDALVFFNGDTALPGCHTCRKKINMGPFITALTVDASVEPGGASATVNMSIPKHFGESVFRDGAFILKPGLEVHIYFRGYFPVVNLMSNIDIDGVDVSDIPQYPYYPVFHGVVLTADWEYSGGYYSASVSCGSMLHFWQYINMCTSGSVFGTRPNNSGVNTNLMGNNFARMSPFSIIYSLYRDTAGAAGGVSFALQSSTNVANRSGINRQSEFSLATRYWERRFAQGMYGLRMYGVSGRLFNAFEQAHFARGVGASISSRTRGPRVRARDPYPILLSDVSFLARAAERRASTVRADQMHAYVDDVSQWGNVNLFESTYESKLEVATQATNICGYEFFQDVDGDLVFKPPMYNLDTKASRVYNVNPEDIISISFSEKEPEATYVTCKGSTFKNMTGLGLDNEWGVQGTFVDYRLVAQFGWRPGSMESAFYSDARSAFYAAAAKLAVLNAGINTCSLTIPLRPEIRPGFPVYIKSVDCFYYVQSFAHSFNFGGQCTTSLQLVARRKKFYAPGNPTIPGVGDNRLSGIDLGGIDLPPKPMQSVDSNGIPRLVGFPNVIMALDPQKVNPLYYLISPDTLLKSLASQRSSQEQSVAINQLIRIALSHGVLALCPDNEALDEARRRTNVHFPNRSSHPGRETVDVISEEDREMIGPWKLRTGDTSGVIIFMEDLLSSVRYIRQRLVREGAARRQRARRRRNQPPSEEQAQNTIIDARTRVSTEELQNEEGAAPTIPGEDRPGLWTILQMVRERLQKEREADGRFNLDNFLNQSANLLDILANKKAAFNPSLPGEYRYYSSSHPNPSHQGPLDLETDMINNVYRFNTPVGETYPVDRMVLPATNITDPRASNFVVFQEGTATRGIKAYHITSAQRTNPSRNNLGSGTSTGHRTRRTTGSPSRTTTTSTTGAATSVSAGDTLDWSSMEEQALLQDVVGRYDNLSNPDPQATSTGGNPSGATQVQRGERRATGPSSHRAGPGRQTPRASSRQTQQTATTAVGRVRDMVTYRTIPTDDIFAMTFQYHQVRVPVDVMRPVFNGGRMSFPDFSVALTQAYVGFANGGSHDSPQAIVSTITQNGQRGGGNIIRVESGSTTTAPFGGAHYIANGRILNQIPGVPSGNATPAAPTTAAPATVDAIARALAVGVSGEINENYNTRLRQCFTRRNLSVSNSNLTNPEVRTEFDVVVQSWGQCVTNCGLSGQTVPGITWVRFRGYETRTITSPVFPVSDAEGYEVFGSYQYGRGLNIQADSNFQRLMSSDDPLRLVDRDTNIRTLIVRYVRALVRGQTRGDTSIQARERQLADALARTPVAAEILRHASPATAVQGRTAQIMDGLRNIYATDTNTALNITNSAYTLAELDPTTNVQSCSCRGAEADLLLAAFMTGNQERSGFLEVDNPDQVTDWVKREMENASVPWNQTQAALRGATEGQSATQLWQTVANSTQQISDAFSTAGSRIDGLVNELYPTQPTTPAPATNPRVGIPTTGGATVETTGRPGTGG